MYKRYKMFIGIFIISLILVLVQYSLISAWPNIFNKVNLLLISIVFFIFFVNKLDALYLALFLGLIFDLLSFHFFGLYLISFFLVVFIGDKVLRNFLTNRSLYSFLGLMLTMNIVYIIIFYSLIYFVHLTNNYLFLSYSSFWNILAWQVLWSTAIALLLFYISMTVSRKLKPFFLGNK